MLCIATTFDHLLLRPNQHDHLKQPLNPMLFILNIRAPCLNAAPLMVSDFERLLKALSIKRCP